MLKDIIKHSIYMTIKKVVSYIVLGMLVMLLACIYLPKVKNGIVDFDTMELQDLSGNQCIRLLVTENYGLYNEKTVHRLDQPFKKNKKLYYLVKVESSVENEEYLISLVVSDADKKEVNKLEQLGRGELNEPLEIICEVGGMNDSEQYTVESYMYENGYDNNRWLVCHMIFCDWDTMVKIVNYLIGVGKVLFVIAILLFLYSISGIRVAKFKREIENNGILFEKVLQDYEMSTVLDRKNMFRIGRLCTYVYSGETPHVFVNKDIKKVAYFTMTQSGKGGIFKKIIHYIRIDMVRDDCGVATVTNKENAEYILEVIKKSMPWVEVVWDVEDI
ncbi:MAG: hypothetical protein IJC76_05280 [Lachnospiraceae bacterium]|nr:hypothetical protein [Lachnospiraceae bacterium]